MFYLLNGKKVFSREIFTLKVLGKVAYLKSLKVGPKWILIINFY